MDQRNRPGRPRRYLETRRRTTVQWSDELLAALNQVRGEFSLGEFTETVLRQHPQVAERLGQQQKEAK